MGFVEGDDIGKGTVDVVVTEGFAGNIAIKTAEGTARQIAEYLRAGDERGPGARGIGYLLAREAFQTLRDKMDPRKANGGVFLGLNGIVIKSHGGTDAEGFAAAVDVGYDMVRYELLNKIRDTLVRHAREEAGQQRLARPLRDRHTFRRSRLRQLSAGAHASPTPSCRGWSIPPTNGSCSAPASASATSRPTASSPPTSASRRRARRSPHAAGRRAIDRPHRARHLDAGQYLSGDRRRDPGGARHHITARRSILQAVCSGFVYALATADGLLRSGVHKRALVIGAETFSRILDWTDRGTCVLFGDGAGAVVLEAQQQAGTREDRGVLTSHLRSDGRHKSQAVSSTAGRPRPARSGTCAWKAKRSSVSRSARSPT